MSRFNTQDGPFLCRVHSVRKRLTDIDGISVKAVIDGIVLAGVLPDDKAEFIEKIEFTQRKTKKGEAEYTEVSFLNAEELQVAKNES